MEAIVDHLDGIDDEEFQIALQFVKNPELKEKESKVQRVMKEVHSFFKTPPHVCYWFINGFEGSNPTLSQGWPCLRSSHIPGRDQCCMPCGMEWSGCSEQLKYSLQKDELLKDARLQLTNNFNEIMMVKQPKRQFVVG